MDEALFNSSQIFKNSSRVLTNYVEEISDKYFCCENETLTLDLSLIEEFGDEIFGEAIKFNLDKYFGHVINYDDFLKLKDLLKHQTGKKVELSSEIKAFKERGKVVFTKESDKEEIFLISLQAGEQVLIHEKFYGIKEIEDRNDVELNDDKNYEYICGDKLDTEFVIRKWNEGDRFFPLGMENTKKVSDFLNEQYVPSYKKKDQLVLTNRNNIIWIIGLRIDNGVKLTDKCRRIYKIWMK